MESIVFTKVIHHEDAIASSSYKRSNTFDVKQGLFLFRGRDRVLIFQKCSQGNVSEPFVCCRRDRVLFIQKYSQRPSPYHKLHKVVTHPLM